VLAALAENESAAREAALKRAVAYQLVTPISGAVVLEAQKQYQEAGLAPVSSDTVPSVPEPEIWMLIALLVALAGIVLARQCRRRVHS
jgi:hypothetical protein